MQILDGTTDITNWLLLHLNADTLTKKRNKKKKTKQTKEKNLA